MSRPRERYVIKEFRNTRRTLDCYYSSLDTLAKLIKRKATTSEIANATEAVRIAKNLFCESIEAMGFTCKDNDDEKRLVIAETSEEVVICTREA